MEFFFFFTFSRKWVGRVMGNEKFYGDGLIDTEISDLLSKGVITESVYERDEFISTIFLRPQKDGTHRMILNLKSLNQYVTYHHFKMDTIHTAVEMMTSGCYMCSVDL